jgi:hypothetical protein
MLRFLLILFLAIMMVSSVSSNPFSKTQFAVGDTTKIDSIPDNWSVYQGDNSGNIMIIRKNNGYEQYAGNKAYPMRCGIALKFLIKTDNGLPLIAKEPALERIEKDIFENFQSDFNSLIVLVITTSGFREYVLYTNDVKKFENRYIKLKSKYSQYTFSTYNEEDKEWATYKSF